MKVLMIKCNSCGTLIEPSHQPLPFEQRVYFGFGDNFHICVDCAKNKTFYDYIFSKRKEKDDLTSAYIPSLSIRDEP
jgi:hypothetical protein